MSQQIKGLGGNASLQDYIDWSNNGITVQSSSNTSYVYNNSHARCVTEFTERDFTEALRAPETRGEIMLAYTNIRSQVLAGMYPQIYDSEVYNLMSLINSVVSPGTIMLEVLHARFYANGSFKVQVTL